MLEFSIDLQNRRPNIFSNSCFFLFSEKTLSGRRSSGKAFKMTAPRQPKDMPGLLKFCLEATRGEDVNYQFFYLTLPRGGGGVRILDDGRER